MNLKALCEFNRFKKQFSSNVTDQEIAAFKAIKEAESMDVNDLLQSGRQFIMVGIVDSEHSARPIVYNYGEGAEYPKPVKLAFFPLIDLRQDLVELQDTIEIVPDPKLDLFVAEQPYDDNAVKLFNIEVVYGKALKKGSRLTPHLMLAEVVSQLASRYQSNGHFLFYVCDQAEECGNLTSAGYHAYRVAVYKPDWLSEDRIPELSVDGNTF